MMNRIEQDDCVYMLEFIFKFVGMSNSATIKYFRSQLDLHHFHSQFACSSGLLVHINHLSIFLSIAHSLCTYMCIYSIREAFMCEYQCRIRLSYSIKLLLRFKAIKMVVILILGARFFAIPLLLLLAVVLFIPQAAWNMEFTLQKVE